MPLTGQLTEALSNQSKAARISPGGWGSGFVNCKKKNVSFVVPDNFPTTLLVAELVPGTLAGKKWMPGQEEFYIYSHSSVVQ